MRKWREVREGTALPRATQLLESSISQCPWKGVLHLPGRGADGVRKLSWRKWCQDFNLYLVFFWVGSLCGPVIVVKIISVLSDKDSFRIKRKKTLCDSLRQRPHLRSSGTVGSRCLNNVVGVCLSPFLWFCFALCWFHFQGVFFHVLVSGNSGHIPHKFSDVNVKSVLHSQLFQQCPWVDSYRPGHVTSLNQPLWLGLSRPESCVQPWSYGMVLSIPESWEVGVEKGHFPKGT